MEIKKNYKSPHEEELTTKTHSFTKNYVGGNMKEEEMISINTVAKHLNNMDEEDILCFSPECDYCDKPKCDAECIPAYEKMIRSWKDDSL